MAADLIGLTLAFIVVGLPLAELEPGLLPWDEIALFLLWLPAWLLGARLLRLYDVANGRVDIAVLDELTRVFVLATVSSFLFISSGVLSPTDEGKFTALWIASILLITLSRSVVRTLFRRFGRPQNTVILGAGTVGQAFARRLLLHPEYGFRVIGFVDDDPRQLGEGLEKLAVLGPPDRLPDLADQHDIDRVIIAFSNQRADQVLDSIRHLTVLDLQVDIVPRFFELVGDQAGLHSVSGLTLVGLPPQGLSRSARAAKRVLDVLGGTIGLFALAPLFLFLALLIKLDSSGPVFFRQERAGVRGRTFRILKFRTMTADADRHRARLRRQLERAGRGGLLKIQNDPRITRMGRFLRRYSLDEFPQLINVLRGDMSLVGPRPLPIDEDERIMAWGRRRLDLKPGMTGLWQVNGRSDLPLGDMLTLDYLYVTNWSFATDIRLLAKTLPALVRGYGAY